jgi:hypothetical protein
LEQALRGAPGTWLVTDRFRLATRYEEDFLAAVIEQFDVAYEERGVVALKASGWREDPLWAADETLALPLRVGPLELTRWAYGPLPSAVQRAQGASLPVELTWRGVGPIGGQINTSLRLLDGGGNVVASADGPPARGIVPTNLFFGTALPDRKSLLLPAGLAAGEYRLEVVAYDLATVTPLGEPLAVGTVVVGE